MVPAMYATCFMHTRSNMCVLAIYRQAGSLSKLNALSFPWLSLPPLHVLCCVQSRR